MGESGQLYFLVTLASGKTRGTHCTGVWVGSTAVLRYYPRNFLELLTETTMNLSYDQGYTDLSKT